MGNQVDEAMAAIAAAQADPVSNILAARGKTHGDFTEHARVTQILKQTAESGPNYQSLSLVQREAIEMILHKVGRIVSGDPSHRDHWDDIAGYATLAANRI